MPSAVGQVYDNPIKSKKVFLTSTNRGSIPWRGSLQLGS